MKIKIKRGDKVFVTTGKDKGKTGIVKKVLIAKNKVIIENINVVKCFSKKKQLVEGQSNTKEMPIHVSNVMHLDPKDNKPTRVRVVFEGNKKLLVAKKSGQIIREISVLKEKSDV